MTWESFFTGVFAVCIILLGNAVIAVLALPGKMTDKPKKKDRVQLKLQKDDPQPTSDQDLGEKKEILRTTHAGEITVQDAPHAFPEEEQQQFKNRQNAVSSDNTADIAPTEQSQEESVFVLYERHWAGKAENGEDKIFLKTFEDKCIITYESLGRNCYATPPKEDVRTKVRRWVLSSISTWSLEELLLEINQTFHLSINICDCCSEEQYRAWIEQQNTEFYSMEIMVDGTKQECTVRRVNEKSCEEVRFQGQTYFWKSSEAIHGLDNYDYAVEVHLNEKVYYLYYTEVPNKNDTLYWVVSQITESTFELLKHPPCDHEKIVFERKIGTIGRYEAGRRSTIYKVLALATGRTIGYYQADDGTRNICLDQDLHDAVKILRDQIITEITKRPQTKYELTKLLYEDAASCFPNGGYRWDGAFFQLDLIDRKLLVEVSTYPNQFGACEQDFFQLSPVEFNRIAKAYHMRPELLAFHSDEDWAMLFDDNLTSAISSAYAALQKQEEERKNRQQKMLAVKIPSELAGLLPDITISEVTIELIQRYGRSSIQIMTENGEYRIRSYQTSHASTPRILSSVEAKWLEQQIENTVNDPDDSVWQSLPGGDTMNIAIKWKHGKDISLRGVKAISKYVDLMGKLRKLSEYGSQEE